MIQISQPLMQCRKTHGATQDHKTSELQKTGVTGVIWPPGLTLVNGSGNKVTSEVPYGPISMMTRVSHKGYRNPGEQGLHMKV